METRRFGVLLNRNRCAYSYALGEALDRAAARSKIELKYIPVTWATSEKEVETAELEEVLEQTVGLDGLVMISSVFSHGLKSLAKFTQRWWPRPASSIGYRLPLVPSVLVDNRGAMQAATRHLIIDHGRREILFIRGRVDSQEATDRYFGFRQALGEQQIINDGARVLQGDFSKASAASALGGLASDVRFDALIASNDEMALAAMAELERRGLRVPEDVAVIGFDDIPAATKSRPTLSSMGQPFSALAEKAIELVIAQCDGRDVPQVSEVPVNVVLRASCGCDARGGATAGRR